MTTVKKETLNLWLYMWDLIYIIYESLSISLDSPGFILIKKVIEMRNICSYTTCFYKEEKIKTHGYKNKCSPLCIYDFKSVKEIKLFYKYITNIQVFMHLFKPSGILLVWGIFWEQTGYTWKDRNSTHNPFVAFSMNIFWIW